MTTPSEFKAIKDLRQIDDQGISGNLLMLFESDNESLKVLLSQLVNYIKKPIEDELIPPGVPQYWPGDTAPQGFVFINNGLTFNTVTYPKLAIAWPNGVIPPHKGLVIECTADGAITGNSEVGEVKSHLHSINHGHGASASSSFSGNTLPGHSHTERMDGRDTNVNAQGNKVAGSSFPQTGGTVNGIQTGETSAGTPSGSVSTSVNINDHNGNSGITGQSRNTVDRINYNVMVRLA